MHVGFKVKNNWYQIGDYGLMESFRLTLEGNICRGREKYPNIIRDFFSIGISAEEIDNAILELQRIEHEMKLLSSDHAIFTDGKPLFYHSEWCKENPDNLGEVFVSCAGQNLIEYFSDALKKAKELGVRIELKSF